MQSKKKLGQANVCVIVLGDIGRSPRMQYHASSLTEHNYNVDIIGYVESSPLAKLQSHPNARIHALSPFPDLNLPTFLKYLFKTAWQMLTLLVALFSVRRPQFILCQNPPAIPALLVCTLYCTMMRSKLIVDWHNYTHSILALGASRPGGLVGFAKWFERYFGQKTYANLCVTQAMQEDLLANWNIK